jgi:hypothetical protein
MAHFPDPNLKAGSGSSRRESRSSQYSRPTGLTKDEILEFKNNPQYIHFIKDVVVEKVPYARYVDFTEPKHIPQARDFDPGTPIIASDQMTTVKIKWFDLHKNRSDEDPETVTAYVAVAPNVERVMRMPFQAIIERSDILEKSLGHERRTTSTLMQRINAVAWANWRTRLKYLFTGRFPYER